MSQILTDLTHPTASPTPGSYVQQNPNEKPVAGKAFVDVLTDLQTRDAKNTDVELAPDENTSDTEPSEADGLESEEEIETSLAADLADSGAITAFQKVAKKPPEADVATVEETPNFESGNTNEGPPIAPQTLMESAVNADVRQSEAVNSIAAASGPTHSSAILAPDNEANHSPATVPASAPMQKLADQTVLPLAATLTDGTANRSRRESGKAELEVPRPTPAPPPASPPKRAAMTLGMAKQDGLAAAFSSRPELQSLSLQDDRLAELSLPSAPSQLSQFGLTTANSASLPQSYAPHVAQQIAAATVRSQGGTTEIALNPKELGRVRMALTTNEGGVSVSIIAERPETADLMRRNVEHLAREFQELGYDQVSFSFGDQSDGADQSSQEGRSSEQSNDPMAGEQPLTGPIMTVALNGSLDLKL